MKGTFQRKPLQKWRERGGGDAARRGCPWSCRGWSQPDPTWDSGMRVKLRVSHPKYSSWGPAPLVTGEGCSAGSSTASQLVSAQFPLGSRLRRASGVAWWKPSLRGGDCGRQKQTGVHGGLGGWVERPQPPLPTSPPCNPPSLSLQSCPLTSAQPCLWGCLACPLSSLRPSLASTSSRKPRLCPHHRFVCFCPGGPQPERVMGASAQGRTVEARTSILQRLPSCHRPRPLLSDSAAWRKPCPPHSSFPTIPAPT